MLGKASCVSGIKSRSESLTILIALKSLVDDCEYAITKSPSTRARPAICSVLIDANLVEVAILESEKVPVVQTNWLEDKLDSVEVICHLSPSITRPCVVSESGTSIECKLQFPSFDL